MVSVLAAQQSTAISARLLDELMRASQYAAAEVCLVQGSGGNASVKSADALWIKASGLTMADVGRGTGYVAVDLALVLEMLGSGRWHPELLVSGNGNLLPSMETGFHALLGPVVLHTHPVYVNAFACMEGGSEALKTAIPGSLWVDYCAPGVDLALMVRDALAKQPSANAIVLANHGLIASGKTADEVVATTERFITVARKLFGDVPPHHLDCRAPARALIAWIAELQSALDRYLPEHARVIMPARWEALNECDPQWFQAHALFPDQVVWRPEEVFYISDGCSAESWLKKVDSLPQRSVLSVEGAGVVFIVENRRVAQAIEENLLAAVLVRGLISRHGRVRELTAADVDCLRNMEAEKYRQAIAASCAEGER